MRARDGRSTLDTNLGPKQTEFGASSGGRVVRGCLGLICCFIGALFLIAVIVGLLKFAWERLDDMLVFGGLFLAGGIALLLSIRAAGQTCVEVYADGLILREGPTATSCRWTDILTVTEKEAVSGDEVIQEAMVSESRAFRLHLQTGEVIALKSYIEGLAELGAIIQEETLPHLFPACQVKLRQGQHVEFGPIRLHREGIEVQGQVLSWTEIQDVKRKGGWIRFYGRGAWGSWKKIKLSEVPNAHVLFEIVARRTGAERA